MIAKHVTPITAKLISCQLGVMARSEAHGTEIYDMLELAQNNISNIEEEEEEKKIPFARRTRNELCLNLSVIYYQRSI